MPSKGNLTDMREILLRTLRFFILGAAAGGVGAFTVLHADDGATPPAPPATSAGAAGAPAATTDGPSDEPAKPDVPDKPAPGPKVFTPTQEISPDQEIDFPADL